MAPSGLDAALLAALEAARLLALVGALTELGVEVAADLEDVNDSDLHVPGVTEIQRRRFQRLRRDLLEQAGRSASSGDTTTASAAELPVPTELPSGHQGSAFEVPLPPQPRAPAAGLPPEAEAAVEVRLDGSGGLCQASQTYHEVPRSASPTGSSQVADDSQRSITARRRPEILVPCVSLSADGTARLEREDGLFQREGQLGCGVDRGWAWLRAKFPKHEGNGSELARAVRAVEGGLRYGGRTYWLASTSKGSFHQGATAWFASPPDNGGPEMLESALGWGTRLKLQRPTEARPHPEFLLRARVKQLFSAVVNVVDANALEFNLVDDIRDEQNRLRNDGAGEVDPEVAEALAALGFPEDALALEEEESGLCRHIPGSTQIRSGGLKGMLVASELLRGTRRVQVPKNVDKFGGQRAGPELGVISFSIVRPTSLGIDAVLRLEARGVPREQFVRLQERRLGKLAGALTRRRAFRVLRVDEDAADPVGSIGRGRTYLASFVTMLLAGFDPEQHPLLSVIAKEQERALEKAQREVRAPGVWAVRGHPEPTPDEGEAFELRGNEVFFMHPCQDEEDGWRVFTGKAVVSYVSDRDPAALRLAEGVDSPALRRKCLPGLLYFSVEGQPLQDGLSWDFDGDYYQVITTPELLEGFEEEHGSIATPVFADSEGPPTGNCESLAGLQSYFLTTFPAKDHIGLYHYQWQMVAGKSGRAANSEEAKKLAAGYSASLDVEKGGPWPPCPPKRSGGFQAKWDFMKNPGDQPRKSPTAAGEIFRMAKRALQELDARVRSPVGLKADGDLLQAWGHASERLGLAKMQALAELAGKIRGRLIERIKAEISRAKADAADLNFDSQSHCQEKDLLFHEWLEQLREEAREQAARHGASLADLAVAAWHLKYVKQGAAAKNEDPDKTFPWTIFCKELCEVKEQARPCCQLAMERHLRLLRRLQKAAVAAKGGGGPAARGGDRSRTSLAEAVRDVQRASFKCGDCRAAWGRKCQDLRLDSEAEDILDAVRSLAEGEVRRVPCGELYYSKAEIERRFRHGKQEGRQLSELVGRLVEDERGGGREGVRRGLELSAVEHHGRLYVVEGNRRLWCLKEAEKRLGKSLSVKVHVADVFLGWIRQQRSRYPASRVFWDKFTTTNGGEDVRLAEDDDEEEDDDGPEAPEESAEAEDFEGLFAEPGLSVDGLKRLYKKLCMRHHPDKGGSTDVFQRLSAAYEEALGRLGRAGSGGQEDRPSGAQPDSRHRPSPSGSGSPPQRSEPGGGPGRPGVIRASRAQRCMQCRGDIHVGDFIENKAAGWCHERCPSSQTSPPPAPAPDPGPQPLGIPARLEQRCMRAQCTDRIFKGDRICQTEDGWCHARCAAAARTSRPATAGGPRAEGGSGVTCPKCGGGMEAKQNRTTGENFWGCLAWRRTNCKGTLPYH